MLLRYQSLCRTGHGRSCQILRTRTTTFVFVVTLVVVRFGEIRKSLTRLIWMHFQETVIGQLSDLGWLQSVILWCLQLPECVHLNITQIKLVFSPVWVDTRRQSSHETWTSFASPKHTLAQFTDVSEDVFLQPGEVLKKLSCGFGACQGSEDSHVKYSRDVFVWRGGVCFSVTVKSVTRASEWWLTDEVQLHIYVRQRLCLCSADQPSHFQTEGFLREKKIQRLWVVKERAGERQ